MWAPPAAIVVAFVMPLTWTGALLGLFVPLPSGPLPAWPQHRTVPVASSAHEWSAPAPAATATAFVIPLTVTGPLAGLVVPLPSPLRPWLQTAGPARAIVAAAGTRVRVSRFTRNSVR